MRLRYILWYILLMVVPALFLALMAGKSLRLEQQRLAAIAREALYERAATHADTLDLLVTETLDTLLDAFAALDIRDPSAIHAWISRQPLVRHAFHWHPLNGLLLPDPAWPTPSETDFLQRYHALFTSRTPWPIDPPTEEAAPPPPSSPLVRARQELARSVRIAPSDLESYAPPASPSAPRPSPRGWLPWFWERELHLLGWIQHPADRSIRGIELELLALLSRFQPLFATEAADRATFALLDHRGEMLLQTPSHPPQLPDAPTVAVPLGPHLPNWHIRATAPPATTGHATSTLLASLLLATFLVALLSGGALLAWQGYRHHRDARRKTTFVSNVSHELKTPLTTIRMYAEMLKEGRLPDPQSRAAYLDVIVGESQRLTRLVNNVLDFSRLEQGRKSYRHEDLSLHRLIRSITEAHQPRLAEAGLHLTLHLPDPDLTLHTDPDALEQVLLNLLDNAIKYARDGREITLHLHHHPTPSLDISDLGPGVPPDHRERIFTSFHRVDDTLTARQPGAGLGLSIGRRIMRDLGGDLTYHDRPGGGATFTIILPPPPIP